MIEADKNAYAVALTSTLPLKHILYIYHLMRFEKSQVKTQILINVGNKANIIILVYTNKLGF